MAHKLISGSDLYKGFKLDKNFMLTGNLNDILPFQQLKQEEKTIDWIKGVADFYEVAGWNNVERKAGKIQKNFWMRNGILNPSDYIVNPNINPFSEVAGWDLPPDTKSPLQQFYALLPNFIDVLRGEMSKADNKWTIEVVDQFSHSQMFEDKRNKFEAALLQQATLEKQVALAKMGITQQANPQEYQQQLQQTLQQLSQIELESKTFRTTAAQWAEKVLQIQDKRYDLREIEPDAFDTGLTVDTEFWHLDMLDDDFRLDLINPMYADYHKGPNVKYVSQGDYFLFFDFMSAGDIVNKHGRKMKEEDIAKLKDVWQRTTTLLVPDYLKSHQDAYYDYTKTWQQATDLNPVRNDALLGQELVYNYMRSPNFDHNIQVDIFSPIFGRAVTGHPNMFRVMRLYWRSMKMYGWLTKINRDGTRVPPTWVDENYKVTIEPQYDNSVIKEDTKDNLLYGEHIDWTWAPEWRHVMKISPNHKHTFWLNNNNFESIYIDGGPVPFQFKGRDNPFDALPPVEGCAFTYFNSPAHSFLDRGKGFQIIYNIALNKVPRQFLDDKGLKVAVDRRTFPTNSLQTNMPMVDPRDEYEERLQTSSILDYSMDREAMAGLGQAALPQVINLSTAQITEFWLNVADKIKWMAAESIGITRARLGGQKASETMYGIEQGINYSENQTAKYFEQHTNLMKRVRQRMLDAAQYYTTFKESSREIYQNEMAENVWIEIEGMENLLPHYNINLESRANVKEALKEIATALQDNTLPISASAKVQALVEGSIPKIITLIKEAELTAQQQEQQKQLAEQQQMQQQLASQERLQTEKLQYDAQQKDLDRQNNIDVELIAQAGGSDTAPADNTDKQVVNQLKQKELANKNLSEQQKLEAKRQSDIEKTMVEREKAQKGVDKARIQGEYALKVAEKNKNKFDKGK